MAERFFRDLTDKALRRGSFHNVVGGIDEYINAHNENLKPLIRTASANDIDAKGKRRGGRWIRDSPLGGDHE